MLAIVTIASIAGAAEARQADAPRRPNIVVIVADDLGYADVGFHGGKQIPMPNLDRLAAEGVRFTNGYVSCPVCSPTRAGLLTGRYQQRFGHEFNPGPARIPDREEIGLPTTETTIAGVLKSAGYRTAVIGKWHLGYFPQYHPLKRGFDEFFGILGGGHQYLPPQAKPTSGIFRGEEEVNEPEYLTDAIAREAAAFIDRQHTKPFFLYLTFNAVHAPLQATDKYLERFKDLPNERRRTYAAMLSAMDDGIGIVLGRLAEHKLDENTLVFFVSDNGGPTQSTSAKNDPLRGVKGTVWEGGIRVPFVLRWKGRLAAGKAYEQPVIALDIAATAAAAAGTRLPADRPIDGVDLVPYVTGAKEGQPHRALYWRFGPQWAIRKGPHKLSKPRGEEVKLFDLASDIGETRDLSGANPELVKELTAEYEAWERELEEPRWQTPPRARARRRAAEKLN